MENSALSQDDFDGPEPDATGKGWVRPAGAEQVEAIFVLAGRQLGIGRVGRVTPPVWLKLDELVNLDALGDPVGDEQAVELTMEDHQVIAAGWSLSFCDSVVQTLQRIAGVVPAQEPAAQESAAPEPTAPESAAPESAAPESAAPEPAAPAPAAPDPATTVSATQPADAPEPVVADRDVEPVASQTVPDAAPHVPPVADFTPPGSLPESPPDQHLGSPRTLELEDVVYLGGHPEQSKKRKRCLVTMDADRLELTGPNELRLTIPWSSVRSVAVQNADEARFRTNTKIHRDASALVLECNDAVTVLLEARECPTIALRTAIVQLLDGASVSVV